MNRLKFFISSVCSALTFTSIAQVKQETVLINAWGLLWFRIPTKYSRLERKLNIRKSSLWLASEMRNYITENKGIEEWTHLLRLKSCFTATLALLLSLKALLTRVVREVQHTLPAPLNSRGGNSSCCRRGILIGISHAHTHQNKSVLIILQNMGLNTSDRRIHCERICLQEWLTTGFMTQHKSISSDLKSHKDGMELDILNAVMWVQGQRLEEMKCGKSQWFSHKADN